MSDIQVFNFQSHQVRTYEIDGQTWFALKDVCETLDLSNATTTASRLDDDELTKLDLGSQSGLTWFVNESGLYSVILRSDKPAARPFRKWVTAEVLPSIRKTGSYGLIKAEHDKLLSECCDHLKTILAQNAEISALKSRPRWSPLTAQEKSRIKELREAGLSWAGIARQIDRSVSAVKAAGRA